MKRGHALQIFLKNVSYNKYPILSSLESFMIKYCLKFPENAHIMKIACGNLTYQIRDFLSELISCVRYFMRKLISEDQYFTTKLAYIMTFDIFLKKACRDATFYEEVHIMTFKIF